MENTHFISAEHLNIEKLYQIISEHQSITLSEDVEKRIIRCRSYLDEKSKDCPE